MDSHEVDSVKKEAESVKVQNSEKSIEMHKEPDKALTIRPPKKMKHGIPVDYQGDISMDMSKVDLDNSIGLKDITNRSILDESVDFYQSKNKHKHNKLEYELKN